MKTPLLCRILLIAALICPGIAPIPAAGAQSAASDLGESQTALKLLQSQLGVAQQDRFGIGVLHPDVGLEGPPDQLVIELGPVRATVGEHGDGASPHSA